MAGPVATRVPFAFVAVSILAAGLSLRTLMASVPPLVEAIRADLGLGAVPIGVLTTLPVLCMGLFAPPASRIGRRLGAARAVSLALVAIAAGNLVRLLGSELVFLYGGTLLAGLGIALAGTLMPGLVKHLLPPHRAGAGTGLSMLAMMVGAASASALAVPLEVLLGTWQRSLAVWGGVALVSLLGWLPLDRRVMRTHAEAAPTTDTEHALPWRSTTAWLVAAYLTFQSWQFYSSLAWVPDTYVSHGWQASRAGLLLSLFTGAQLVSGLVAPTLTDRVPDWRVLLVASAVISLCGELGVWLAPTAVPWLWVVLLGLGQGAAFPLGLVLLVRYAVSPAASARLTAMAFFVSYTLASFGPTVMGAVRDATAGFASVWMVLAAVCVPQILVSLLLRPTREDVA